MKRSFWTLVGTLAIALGLSAGAWAILRAQEAGPSGRPPAPVIYQGTVSVGGGGARAGARVNAYVDGAFCSGATTDGASYYMLVPSLTASPARPECQTLGGVLTFKINGVGASPIASFDPEAGLVSLSLQAPAPCASLTPDWNNVSYLGPSGPVDERVTAIKDKAEAIFRWNNASKGWAWFFVGAPAATNTLSSLEENDALWVLVKSPAQWCW